MEMSIWWKGKEARSALNRGHENQKGHRQTGAFNWSERDKPSPEREVASVRLTIEDPNTCGPFSKTDPTSIWFEATNTAAKRAYSNLLDSESELRGMTLVGNLSLRRDTLRQQLVKEWTLRTLSTEVQACARSERALFFLMQAITRLENQQAPKRDWTDVKWNRIVEPKLVLLLVYL